MGYEQLCSREEQETLAAFSRLHPLLRAEIEPDEGSMRTLESMAAEQIKRKKRLR